MNLSERDRRILSQIHLRADLPISQLATLAGCQPHSVRRTIASYHTRGVLSEYALINPYALGLFEYSIYFSCSGGRARDKFLQALINSERVLQVMELGGEFSFGASLLHRDPWSAAQLLTDLCNQTGVSLLRKTHGVYLEYTQFRRRYLDATKSGLTSLTTKRPENRITIDELDHQLLKAIAASPRASISELSRMARAPASTLEYRMKKLQAAEVYNGTIFQLETSRIGIQVVWLLIAVKSFGAASADKVLHFCSTHPRVTSLVKALGTWDFEVSIEVNNLSDVPEITRELENQLGGDLVDLRVAPCLSVLKWCMYPFRNTMP